MKIIKYSKQGNNKYKVYLENNEIITLYEDVILKNELLIKKEISDVSKLQKENQKYEIYDVALKYLRSRVRSTFELRTYLTKKGYLDDDIERIIKKLIDQNYLNDQIYCRSYVMDRINLSNDGPEKIVKYFESMHIDSTLYEEELSLFTKEIIHEKIEKYIDKMVKTNKKSRYILKNKIMLNLINLGYLKEDIDSCLSEIDAVDDSLNKEKAKDKLYKRLSRKYHGEELEKKVREKLYQLGYFG